MSTEQGLASEEIQKITPTRYITRTMARDQYQYYQTIIQIKQNRCYYSNSRQVYKDDQAKDNHN